MKAILIGTLITLLMAWNINCFAQDTILQRIGEPLFSKVTEVSSTSIKYKRFDNLEGPVYVIDRDLVTFVKYKNGAVDSFPEIKPWFKPVSIESQQQELKPVLLSAPAACWHGRATGRRERGRLVPPLRHGAAILPSPHTFRPPP